MKRFDYIKLQLQLCRALLKADLGPVEAKPHYPYTNKFPTIDWELELPDE